jgi:hypothetical protein
MLVRKIDRLLQMMRKPETPPGFNIDVTLSRVQSDENLGVPGKADILYLARCYVAENIFAAIRQGPGGEDGTVLAEVRDLRRYLLLVEAEMMARGVVQVPEPKPPADRQSQLGAMVILQPGERDLQEERMDCYQYGERPAPAPTTQPPRRDGQTSGYQAPAGERPDPPVTGSGVARARAEDDGPDYTVGFPHA